MVPVVLCIILHKIFIPWIKPASCHLLQQQINQSTDNSFPLSVWSSLTADQVLSTTFHDLNWQHQQIILEFIPSRHVVHVPYDNFGFVCMFIGSIVSVLNSHRLHVLRAVDCSWLTSRCQIACISGSAPLTCKISSSPARLRPVDSKHLYIVPLGIVIVLFSMYTHAY